MPYLVVVILWSGPMFGKLDKNVVDYNTARRFPEDIIMFLKWSSRFL